MQACEGRNALLRSRFWSQQDRYIYKYMFILILINITISKTVLVHKLIRYLCLISQRHFYLQNTSFLLLLLQNTDGCLFRQHTFCQEVDFTKQLISQISLTDNQWHCKTHRLTLSCHMNQPRNRQRVIPGINRHVKISQSSFLMCVCVCVCVHTQE